MNVQSVSNDGPVCPLLDPEGPLSSTVPSSSIHAANLEVKPVVIEMKVLEHFRISHRSMNN